MARRLKFIRMASEPEGVSSGYIVLIFCLSLLCQIATAGFAAEEAPVADQYLLGPGDLFEVRVTGDESVSRAFSGQFLVEADGIVNYPAVGNLPTEGVTLSQVAMLGPSAAYTILRQKGNKFEITRADELSFLHRGDILHVDRGSEEMHPPVHGAYTDGLHPLCTRRMKPLLKLGVPDRRLGAAGPARCDKIGPKDS